MRAPQPQIEQLELRMGWEVPWYTVIGEDFQTACGTTEYFALDVFLRDGDQVFLTYAITGRGVEPMTRAPMDRDRTERLWISRRRGRSRPARSACRG